VREPLKGQKPRRLAREPLKGQKPRGEQRSRREKQPGKQQPKRGKKKLRRVMRARIRLKAKRNAFVLRERALL
jgi:hypothetical protein